SFSVAREGDEERWVPVHATNGKSIKALMFSMKWVSAYSILIYSGYSGGARRTTRPPLQHLLYTGNPPNPERAFFSHSQNVAPHWQQTHVQRPMWIYSSGVPEGKRNAFGQ
ncbi:hypothetical protein Tco_1498541, partial [Tanacetum coccineum]